MKMYRKTATMGLCLLLLAVSACGLAYPAVEGRFDRTLSVTGAVDLEVDTGSGRISVRSGSTTTVEIHGLIRANDDRHSDAREKIRYLEANPPIRQDGNGIRIGQIDNETYRNNVSISYEILVPAETTVRSRTGSGSQDIEGIRGPVDAETGSGSITMTGIGDHVTLQTGSGSIDLDQIAGDVNVQTGSGSIRAERVAGSVRAQTGSGGIRLDLTAAERGGSRDVSARTGSGSITVSGIDGSLNARSGSGSVRASGFPSGNWTIATSSGGVELEVDSAAVFDFYAHASSGVIRVDLPFTMTGSAGKHEMRGKVGGGGPMVEVTAGSGSITIR